MTKHNTPSVSQAPFQIVATIVMEFTYDELRRYVSESAGLGDDLTMTAILETMRETMISEGSLRHDATYAYRVMGRDIEIPAQGLYGHREIAQFDRDHESLTVEFVGDVEFDD